MCSRHARSICTLLLSISALSGCATAPAAVVRPHSQRESSSFAARREARAATTPRDRSTHSREQTSDSREQIVHRARAAIGRPYRLGARGPDAFDCSGLVVYSYAASGLSRLPHSSRALYASTRHIPLDELLPGDLLFFDFDGKGVSHVAIFVGDGVFVHAPKSGRAVESVRFDHPYWRHRLRLAGRVRELR